mgnify:FL=1
MLHRSLTTALRALRRRPGFSQLNVLGLSVGMACCLLIGLYVQHELSYDAFHANSDRIYRIVQHDAADEYSIGWTGDGMVDVLRGVPEVASVVQLTPVRDGSLGLRNAATGTRTVFEEPDLLYATPSLFSTFDFSLSAGNPETALASPGSIVLTAPLVDKYFGDADPMGRSLQLSGQYPLTVTGVMDAPPANTHLQFSALVSRPTFFTNMGRPARTEASSFWWPRTWMFVELAPDADKETVQAQIEATTDARRSEDIAAELAVVLQPLAQIHLHSDAVRGNLSTVGSQTRVWTFATIAGFILLIACVNFMNLSTSRATDRAQEVGVRKAVGGSRRQLIQQFLAESLLLSLGSTALALVLASVLLPVFEQMLGVTIAFGVFTNPVLLGSAVLVALLAGLGAGSYPAFLLSRFAPAQVLRGAFGSGGEGHRLRQGLVVAQFAISIVLIVATAVAYQQLRYMQTADLGFDRSQIVTLETHGAYDALRAEVARAPGVVDVTGALLRPGIGRAVNILAYEFNGSPPPSDDQLALQSVDVGYFEMLGVDVVAGRTFSPDRRSDLGTVYGSDEQHLSWWWRDRALVINRAAAEQLGMTPDSALGQTIRLYQQEGGRYYNDVGGQVVGVVENFHTGSLRTTIPPLVFTPSLHPIGEEGERTYYAADYLLAKVAPGTVGATVDALRTTWKEVNPDAPFELSFLDESLDRLYRTEARMGRVIGVFAGLALFVACLGLFGLATYSARRRRKEIGIRKAVGASSVAIVRLLSTDFVRLVLIAVVLAAPPAYLLTDRWLADFAYRVDLGPMPFVLAAVAALLITLATVSSQAVRAARIDPSQILRHE